MQKTTTAEKMVGGPFKPSFGVQFHDMLYKMSPDILYTPAASAARGGV